MSAQQLPVMVALVLETVMFGDIEFCNKHGMGGVVGSVASD